MTETLTIDWEPDRHPVSGAVTAGSRPAHPFIGWLELLALLQDALTAGAEETEMTTPEEGP